MSAWWLRTGLEGICAAVLVVTECESEGSVPGKHLTIWCRVRNDAETFWLEPVYLIDVNVPTEDVDAVLNSVTEAVSLAYGAYDQVAFISSPGMEQFRSLEGSRAGKQESMRRVSTSRVSFSIPKDPAVLDKAIAAIRLAHPYEEPVVNVGDGWASRARDKGDEDNPHRWWNRRKKQGPRERSGEIEPPGPEDAK